MKIFKSEVLLKWHCIEKKNKKKSRLYEKVFMTGAIHI